MFNGATQGELDQQWLTRAVDDEDGDEYLSEAAKSTSRADLYPAFRAGVADGLAPPAAQAGGLTGVVEIC
jgi:hypothetical protein